MHCTVPGPHGGAAPLRRAPCRTVDVLPWRSATATICAFAQVWYCSVECQKTHWKEGGHKKQCKALQGSASSHAGAAEGADATMSSTRAPASGPCTVAATAKKGSAATSRPTAVAKASASDGGACIICLDGDPPPIQSGCACRGDAGLAHVECRAEAAAHRMASSKKLDGWWLCATCGQQFTAAMQLGLAEAWWSGAQRLPEENVHRLDSASNLADALLSQGKYAEAETMYRKVVAVQQRVMGPVHPNTLGTTMNLASALVKQGKYLKAETMYRELLAVQKRVVGPEHPNTLSTASNLANALFSQGKHTDAETMHGETLAIQKRVLGPEHPHTMNTVNGLANALCSRSKYTDAETIYRELLAVQKRVLGPEHPNTMITVSNLANALYSRGKHTDAETMMSELLAIQKQLLGPEHPSTLQTAKNLAACVHASRSISDSAK
jgi:tetratricopeptide (TPR) repeat protein